MIFPECFAFYPEKFCKFSKTLFRKCLYPQLLNNSINFTKLFFSEYLTFIITIVFYIIFYSLKNTFLKFIAHILSKKRLSNMRCPQDSNNFILQKILQGFSHVVCAIHGLYSHMKLGNKIK